MTIDIESFKSDISSLSVEDLNNLIEIITEERTSRRDYELSKDFYEKLRMRLLNRYGAQQINGMPIWTACREERKAKFHKMYTRAVLWFEQRGYKDTLKLETLMLIIVSQSQFLKNDKLSIADIYKSLERIEEVFAYVMPEYHSNGEFSRFLCKVVNGR